MRDKVFSWLEHRLQVMFGLDLRSLAVFRVGLGLLLLMDLGIRSVNLVAHYSDFGVLPRVEFIEHYTKYFLSLHLMSGLWQVQSILFLLAAIFALMLLAGYKTRLATIVSWVLLISLHNRNPMVLQGGDVELRMMLFWAMFLPLGARFSVDSRLKKRVKPLNGIVFSLAGMAYLIQISMVYWFNALMKTDAIWHKDVSAVYYALQIDQFVTPLGLWLQTQSWLLPWLTRTVIALEWLAPLLLLMPVFNWFFRSTAIIALMLMHAGFGLHLQLGLFPWISGLALLALVPWQGWELLRGFVRKEIKSIKIMSGKFDGKVIYSSLVNSLLAAVFLVYVIFWNITTLPEFKNQDWSNVQWFGYLFRLDQTWDMFSPKPLDEDGWYVVVGELQGGEKVDLFNDGKPVSYEKPERVALMYWPYRWRKYLMNLWIKDNAYHRPWYVAYLCREWNQDHYGNERVEKVALVFMLEKTLADYQIAEVERVSLGEFSCF